MSYRPKTQDVGEQIKSQVKGIINEVKKRRKINKTQLKKLTKDLNQSQTLRSDFMTALQLKGKITAGLKYYANGRSNEYIESKNNKFYRYLPNGVSEVFNSDGSLSRIYDKFGNYIDFTWTQSKITITDNKGRRLILTLNSSTGKVKEARFGKNLVAKYKHDGKEDLREAWRLKPGKTSGKLRRYFKYAYDGLHNLREVTHSDKTTEKLTYDTRKDWVMSFKNRKGCLEEYDYWKNPKNANHYSSEVKKVCNGKNCQ